MHAHLPGVAYRAPCGGANPPPQLGGCFQHWVTGESHVKLFENLTRVTDYAASPVASGIPPYSRPALVGTLPNCAGSYDCGDGSNGAPFCGPWDAESDPLAGPEHASAIAQAGFANYFHETTGTYLDLSQCRKLGFKQVQAHKVWHGALPYNSTDRGDYPDVFVSGCACYAKTEIRQPTQTLYLTLAVHADLSVASIENPDGPATASLDTSDTVAKDTGKHDYASCSADGYFGDYGPTIGNIADMSPAGLFSLFCTRVSLYVSNVSIEPHIVYNSDGISWDYTDDDGAGNTFHSQGSLTFSGSEFHESVTGHGEGGGATQDESTTLDVVLTETTVTYSYDDSNEDSTHGLLGETIFNVSCTLSNPYTYAQLYADTVALLDEWDLSDDVEYPWRTDAFVTVAPLVTRYEYPTAQAPSPCYPDPFNVCSCEETADYDGSIIGKPMPHGYNGYFDFRHLNYDACFDEDAGTCAQYVTSYGAYTPAFLPQTATAWTDNLSAHDTLPQAFVKHAGGGLSLAKYAEIIIRRPSVNFARPCGADRYLIDESAVFCIASVDTMTIQLSTDRANTFTNADHVWVCGAGVLDGVWRITRDSDYQITLTTQVVSADEMNIDRQCYTGQVGKIRFRGAPPLCGSVAVTFASATSPITLTLAEPHFLRDGDSIIVAGVQGVSQANGTFTVTFVDPYTVTLDATSGTGHYHSGGLARSPNAFAEQWNDEESKGDYTVIEWKYDNREVAEIDAINGANPDCGVTHDQPRLYQNDWGLSETIVAVNSTQACLPLKNCCPSVVCISPNGEDFCNGTTYGFDAGHADVKYGALWQMQVVQSMLDPLYQSPARPCTCNQPFQRAYKTEDGACTEDVLVGSCEDAEDGDTRYFPASRLVEARQSLPAFAPGLPANIYIGCLTQPEINISSQPHGNICLPQGTPGPNGCSAIPATHSQPWTLFLNELACVCDGGRFSEFYQADGIGCADSQLVEPP